MINVSSAANLEVSFENLADVIERKHVVPSVIQQSANYSTKELYLVFEYPFPGDWLGVELVDICSIRGYSDLWPGGGGCFCSNVSFSLNRYGEPEFFHSGAICGVLTDKAIDYIYNNVSGAVIDRNTCILKNPNGKFYFDGCGCGVYDNEEFKGKTRFEVTRWQYAGDFQDEEVKPYFYIYESENVLGTIRVGAMVNYTDFYPANGCGFVKKLVNWDCLPVHDNWTRYWMYTPPASFEGVRVYADIEPNLF